MEEPMVPEPEENLDFPLELKFNQWSRLIKFIRTRIKVYRCKLQAFWAFWPPNRKITLAPSSSTPLTAPRREAHLAESPSSNNKTQSIHYGKVSYSTAITLPSSTKASHKIKSCDTISAAAKVKWPHAKSLKTLSSKKCHWESSKTHIWTSQRVCKAASWQ